MLFSTCLNYLNHIAFTFANYCLNRAANFEPQVGGLIIDATAPFIEETFACSQEVIEGYPLFLCFNFNIYIFIV
jgi:hypothetical protein